LLVYGDQVDKVQTAAAVAGIVASLQSVQAMQAGMVRHAALAMAFIESGRLLQGVTDASFESQKLDRSTTETRALAEFVHGLAAAVIGSWRTQGGTLLDLPSVPDIGGGELALKVAEGYAFYAVYPEAFADAAGTLVLAAPPRVIGIRSIGTSLGAIVAAALDAPPATAVRPFGDPFDRRIAIAPELEAALLDGPAHFVIVDEGPGLSGSSFGAVADWLEARGIPLERIAFVCSHAGAPGPNALARHRDRWDKVQRVVADFGPQLPERVCGWAEALLGVRPEQREISGGGWRALQDVTEPEWPPVNPTWERRKFLLNAGDRQWLARFAGLGPDGQRKLAIAQRLYGDGWAPKPIGLVHGILIEEWHGEAARLPATAKPISAIADYLAARVHLPVPRAGASLAELHCMAARNIGLKLGRSAEAKLDRWLPRLDALQKRVVLICSDGRMDRHEWLLLPGGGMLKADAVDHHAGHDLIGCQDIGWDVAGAAVEFALCQNETAELAATVKDAAGWSTDADLLEFLIIAYLAFRLGQAEMSASTTDPREAERWSVRSAQLANRLQLLLD
jgi:hypothetical protein